MDDTEKYKDLDLIKKIRKKCFNLPYIFFIFEVAVPTILTTLLLFATGSHHKIMVTKILILIVSFLFVLAVYSFIFAKSIYSEILSKTYSKDSNIGFRVEIWKKISLQILPIFVAAILITSLIGYSRTVAQKEDIYFSIYNKQLNSIFDSSREYLYDEVIEKLNEISLLNDETHSKFIILPNEEINTISGPEVSNFVKKYTLEISEKYDGRTYDSYGVDAQGSTIKLKTDLGTIYVGILFSIDAQSTLTYFIINFVSLLVLLAFVLYLVSKSLSNDLLTVANGFSQICTNEQELNSNLPVISNDEIGDLVSYFNKIQKQQKDYLNQLHNNQDMLMEKERLASLGQLIGGISHNLKTPIMSISGAAEGLTDLIKEYEASVGDSDVTVEDHHAIANDMKEWVDKIHSYTAYMSDIITAVKGQAVALSENQNEVFTIDELLKRVNILMKHEIRNASLLLETNIEVPASTELHGDVNSLVQVVNNLITNAIHSYNGKKDETIILTAKKSDNNLIISVSDHGCGMPDEVKEKLFKSMITTKGKNGTGLGMFMSYSTIKGHFNGDITFESEVGKGTTFNIILPLPNN
ncbi:MAG: sensor histidine kinase [Clostridia bacterium]